MIKTNTLLKFYLYVIIHKISFLLWPLFSESLKMLVYWGELFFAPSERMIRCEVDTVIRPRIWQPETWNLWFYLQGGEKSQGREGMGEGGCFSGPGLFVAESAPETCRSFSPSPSVLPPCLILSSTHITNNTNGLFFNVQTNMCQTKGSL